MHGIKSAPSLGRPGVNRGWSMLTVIGAGGGLQSTPQAAGNSVVANPYWPAWSRDTDGTVLENGPSRPSRVVACEFLVNLDRMTTDSWNFWTLFPTTKSALAAK